MSFYLIGLLWFVEDYTCLEIPTLCKYITYRWRLKYLKGILYVHRKWLVFLSMKIFVEDERRN